MSIPAIQWYPGHIAKAEKALKEQLNRVDVVLEVRDARIPLATHHPQIDNWVGTKNKVLVINRLDTISPAMQKLWQESFLVQGQFAYFTNAKTGVGVAQVAKAAQKAGVEINQRRSDRGMLPRPVRAVVIGFPNVGKSALINRLLKRRVVESAARPGVTRQLRWIRISDRLELLDAPGVIPSKLDNQENALKLAICDDIGDAAYDNQRVSANFIDLIQELPPIVTESFISDLLESRYKLHPGEMSGEDYLHAVAELGFKGDVERTARQMLTDFRKGVLGAISLEVPPS
ncbi:ribosome biogenesis GTPase YlqF [Merismopedia glauca]|uniref:Ribosome biogenesis GTPase A n=1 Tax=Merismopedia glauca CCAP 1448/3 TaxID=1296344 RepID=A0A2T1C7X8_9CYAN|nr:ribosome biogenesis GTPase YlqF [Merismopedia glauca]PSB04382.1 ribosome biogenesis GTPase YlqF [Merismopedia glauca CCAP 1448/3]